MKAHNYGHLFQPQNGCWWKMTEKELFPLNDMKLQNFMRTTWRIMTKLSLDFWIAYYDHDIFVCFTVILPLKWGRHHELNVCLYRPPLILACSWCWRQYIHMDELCESPPFCLSAGKVHKPVCTPEAIWCSGPAAQGTYTSSIKCPA